MPSIIGIKFAVPSKLGLLRLYIINTWYEVLEWLISAHGQYHNHRRQRRFLARRRLSNGHNIPPITLHSQVTNSNEDEDGPLLQSTGFHSSQPAPRTNAFCRLPKEIRLMIYEQCSFECQELRIEAYRKYSCLGIPRIAYQIPPYKSSLYKSKTDRAVRGFLSLPFTCRLIYADTINVLCERPRFQFDHPEDVCGLQDSLLPQRWTRITKVQLDYDFSYCDFLHHQSQNYKWNTEPLQRRHARGWPSLSYTNINEWRRCCQSLASLPNLQRLDIGAWCEQGARWPLMPMLNELMQITRPRHFQVRTIMWPWDNCRLEPYEHAPFELLFWVGNREGQETRFAKRSFHAPYSFVSEDETNR